MTKNQILSLPSFGRLFLLSKNLLVTRLEPGNADPEALPRMSNVLPRKFFSFKMLKVSLQLLLKKERSSGTV
jgi:hypothetical protein